MKYKCRKTKAQEYGCQVCVTPFFKDKLVCFDKCLANELFYLWDMGIKTTGCCCGNHLDIPEGLGYIGVEDEFIAKMKELGYKVAFNECRPNDEDSFYPKTKLPK